MPGHTTVSRSGQLRKSRHSINCYGRCNRRSSIRSFRHEISSACEIHSIESLPGRKEGNRARLRIIPQRSGTSDCLSSALRPIRSTRTHTWIQIMAHCGVLTIWLPDRVRELDQWQGCLFTGVIFCISSAFVPF